MSPLLGRTDHAARTLPIADMSTVRAHTKVLMRDHRGPLGVVLGYRYVGSPVIVGDDALIGSRCIVAEGARVVLSGRHSETLTAAEQELGDGVEVVLGVDGEVGALGEVLA